MNSDVPPSILLSSFDAIIFDLGGVILPLFPEATVRALSDIFARDARDFYTQGQQVPFFDEYERGQSTSSAFRAAVVRAFGTKTHIRDDVLDAAWNAMLGHLPPENLQFLQTVHAKKRTFLLSNTNEIHIRQFLADYANEHEERFGPFESFFEHAHYSFELGMRKPEARIYEALRERHDLTPGRTLFIDDSRENVAAASALGFLGVLHPTNAALPPRFVEEEPGT